MSIVNPKRKRKCPTRQVFLLLLMTALIFSFAPVFGQAKLPALTSSDSHASSEHYAGVAFQAAEQGQGGDIQKAANNILNPNFGHVNDAYYYRGTDCGCGDWRDNFFPNIVQLIGELFTYFIDGWINDTAQSLAKFLRAFVSNFNMIAGGWYGQQNDGIALYIQQCAGIMYGIAVGLLLLLFIRCIDRRQSADLLARNDNLKRDIGRLIFTAGILVTCPTIYLFEMEISNEIIKSIYLNSADKLLMLDFALAQTVRDGIGAGAFGIYFPGQLVGQELNFASIVIFGNLCLILILQLGYLLFVKSVQMVLQAAQYMLAPMFLVFFATPNTESYAIGYVKVAVESSLWTFAWASLLKVITIVLFSSFNPWAKVLVSIALLQLMIRVPGIIAKARISPLSAFATGAIDFGTLSRALNALKNMCSSIVSAFVNWYMNESFAEMRLRHSKYVEMIVDSVIVRNPDLRSSLNRVSGISDCRNRKVHQDAHIHAQPGMLPADKEMGSFKNVQDLGNDASSCLRANALLILQLTDPAHAVGLGAFFF